MSNTSENLTKITYINSHHEVPNNPRLICVYELNMNITEAPITLFFHRQNGIDRLWSGTLEYGDENKDWRVFLTKIPQLKYEAWTASIGTEEFSALRLLESFHYRQRCYGWPTKWYQGELVNKESFDVLRKNIEAKLDENRISALNNSSEVIDVAKKLNLNPEPDGSLEYSWVGNCPGGNHKIEFQTHIDSFYCGYCRRGGKSEELKEFVREQQLQKTAKAQRDKFNRFYKELNEGKLTPEMSRWWHARY
jgi:hypothetical protein